MTWQQLILKVSDVEAEACSHFLMEAGAASITLEDCQDVPILEPLPGTTPLWQETRLIGLFSPEINLISVIAFLKKYLPLKIYGTLTITPLIEEDWTINLKKDFVPSRFGKRLLICPTWCAPEDPDAVTILLDPGMAFGTGTHPTTRLCLEWLDENPPFHQTVIDYGCGSGILGIAALKLGAKKVFAIDYDPQALASTTANASQNGLSTHDLIPLSPDDLQPVQVELLIANILMNPIIELAEHFATLLLANGKIVLSGILANQQEEVIVHYKKWFHSIEVTSLAEWMRITAIRF
jgi:ribosomal protein L11 methyltransferase